MPQHWRYSPYDETAVRQLARKLQVSSLVAQILLARGYADADAAAAFLETKLTDLHDPSLLPGVDEAADQIVAAARSGRRITIYGDYDVDGVTATSMLSNCLELLDAKVDYYIPSRLEEGYGLNSDALRQLHEEDPQRLIVSVDCGIASVHEAQVARELGLELIITDHHTIGDELPDAAVLVHPRLPGSQYPFGELCGAGVAFKLAWAICQRFGDSGKASPRMREFLKQAVGLTAIGTIADVVPLTGENRIIVRYGLQSLRDRCSLGLRSLLHTCNLSLDKPIRSEDIAFGVAPRVNAAGRLKQARLAVELLTTEKPDRATSLASYLDQLNKERQKVERKILKQAKEQVAENSEWTDHAGLVLASDEWHAGVIGIVANRVAEHFQRPTILIAMDRQQEVGQGSGRSFAGFDLYSAIKSCSDHLIGFGGHHAAAGLKIEPEKIDDFRDAFQAAVNSGFAPESSALELDIDAEVRLADVTHRAVLELDRLGPFGAGNRAPLFAATGCRLARPPKTMGEGDRHLSVEIDHYGTRMRAVAFGKGEWAQELSDHSGAFDISFAPNINSFRGYEKVELRLVDWRAHESEPAPTAAGS